MPVHHSPIKENDPPIQDLQIAAKTSGPSNLSREGWDEDQCRNFLVRVLDWVPRNFNYDDGLRVIHPQLQERFGDENMDLACGVLDELIEIDNYNPFPGAAFQRWKYTHRNRHDNFQLPHVPHTTTIMAQVVPTRRLMEWRARNNTPTAAEGTHLSPTSSTFKTGISTVTHRSAWRIEHTLFVSTGGGRATVHYCPNPEEFHMRLWDPNYGRAGNPAPQKSHSQSQSLIRIGFMAEAPVIGRSSEGNALFNSDMATVSPKMERKRARALSLKAAKNTRHKAQIDHSIVPAVGFRDAVYEDLSAHRHLPKPGTKFAYSTIPNVPLPHGVQIPNAIFGRKHHLVPQGIQLPADFVKGQVQPTAGILGVAKAEHLLALAESAVHVESRKANDMNENNRKERDESIMKEYFTYFNGPFTADLFYDGSLDFRWLPPSKDLTSQTPDIDHSPSTSAKKKGFFSRSPANKKSANSSPGGAPSQKASKDSLAAQRKENRRKQITTVQGTPQLVNPQPNKHVFRDSRFFKAFQRKSIATSPKMEQVPSFGRESAQANPADSRGSKAIGSASDLGRTETGILRFSGQKFEMLLPPSSIEDEGLSRPDSNTLPAETKLLSSSSLPETPNKQQTTRVSRKELSNYSIGTTMSSSDTPKTPTHPPRRRSRADQLSRAPLREVLPRAPLRKVSGNVIANEHLTLQPKVFDNRKLPVNDLVSERRKKLDSDLKLNSFDGAGDENFTPDRKAADVDQNNAQSLSNNTHYLRDDNYLDPHNIKQSMDPTHNFAHRSAQPPPLQIRKQSVTHLRAATKQRIRINSNPERSPTDNSFLPQRTSSIINSRRVEDSEPSFQNRQTDTASTLVNNSQSSTKTRTIVPDNSSDIMGDFIALDGIDAKGYQETTTDDDIALLNVAAKHRYPKPIHNPYEFEKSPLLDRLDDEGQLATFRNFMREQEAEPVQPLRKSPHVKNSRSEGNTGWITITHEPTPTVNISTKPKVNNFHRSESSPVVSPTREPSLQDPLPSTEHDFLSHYYAEDELSGSPARHSRQLRDDTFRKERRVMEDSLNASTSNLSHNYRAASRSPTRRARQDNLHESYSSSSSQHYTSSLSDPRSSNPRSSSSTTNRQRTKSPTKALDDVDETEEFDARTPRARAVTEANSSPPKRTRSPMKKMFGENGWLTHSPIIKQEPYPALKKPTPKKTSMMGRIKNKFGEIAEKADMSPMRRSERERRPAQSLITRSITPFEQARIYTELELMMVHTANLFLMNQFSEARIAIDTIRKTIDGWKSKGRPMVIEFMYDQVTQRNLVALNQHSMRFHGPGSGDNMRVSSMLYSWKQVANIMSIRTFCDTDPVILKLLFDIENILELLGAGEPFMVRLQDISRGVKETIVRARHKKEMEDAKTHSRGQRAALNNDFHSDTPPRGRSMSTPYNDPLGSYHG